MRRNIERREDVQGLHRLQQIKGFFTGTSMRVFELFIIKRVHTSRVNSHQIFTDSFGTFRGDLRARQPVYRRYQDSHSFTLVCGMCSKRIRGFFLDRGIRNQFGNVHRSIAL